jgi:tetratricopeptide (TPR) repeat protein
LQHNPNDAQANYWYSLLLRTLGRPEEALRYSTQAIALDPLHPILLSGHILNCIYADKPALVKASLENGRGLFEQSFAFQIARAYEAMERGAYTQAVQRFEQALTLNPDDRGQLPLLMYCEAKRGNQPRAVQFLRELTATTPRADYERAVVLAGLNQPDRSLHYLNRAANGGYFYRDTRVIAPFRPYHQHPTFKEVLRRFGLPD